MMSGFSTLTQALDARASSTGNLTYIEGAQIEQEISFKSLHARALGLLYQLQTRKLRPGDRLIIYINDNKRFIDAFWACLYGGLIPIPVAVGLGDHHRYKLFRIFTILSNAAVYTDEINLARLASFSRTNGLARVFSLIKTNTILTDEIDEISTPGEKHESNPKDVAFIQFSSGATSDPKGVVLTHKNILTNINAIIEGANFTPKDVSLSWMPLTHDMGLIGFHLNMLVCGISHYLMPTDLFVRRPLLWLSKVSEKRANILCSPNFGYRHLLKSFDASKLHGADLSGVRLIFNGAEPISAKLCEQFLDRLTPFGLRRTAMFTVYGLAEATLAVSFPVCEQLFKTVYVDRNALKIGSEVRYLSPDNDEAISFVTVGRPVRDCQVKITDQNSKIVQEHVVGHIYIKGDNVSGGYFNEATVNQSVFDHEGWLNTGDLGFFTHGELVITGRTKEIIFVNGQNFFPHDLESLVLLVDELELGKVVVTGTRAEDTDADELLIFLLFRGQLKDFLNLAGEVSRVLNEKSGLEVTHVIPVKRIPKTTSGKIQRHVLEEAYRKGEFFHTLEELRRLRAQSELVDSGSLTEIERKLKMICDASIPDKKIGINESLFDIGTSSLVLAQIHEGIEDAFPGLVDITDLFDYPTIAELARHLEEKMIK